MDRVRVKNRRSQLVFVTDPNRYPRRLLARIHLGGWQAGEKIDTEKRQLTTIPKGMREGA